MRQKTDNRPKWKTGKEETGAAGGGPRRQLRFGMTNVRPPVTSLQEHLGEIIEAVKRLPESAKGEFLERLIEVNFNDAGDRQIETDLLREIARLREDVAQIHRDIQHLKGEAPNEHIPGRGH